jgi:RES domain/HEPN/RES N-terminal domain 1
MGQDDCDYDLYSWATINKLVCTRCVQDNFLQRLVRKHRGQLDCNYCDSRSTRVATASVNVLMSPIAARFRQCFSDEVHAGCSNDSDAADIIQNKPTLDALQSFEFEISENVLEDIADAFENNCWVDAVDGEWMGSHEHEELTWSWEKFTHQIKHEQRFFFEHVDKREKHQSVFPPSEMLREISKLVVKHKLLRKIESGVELFRVRTRNAEKWPLNEEQLGAPRADIARAGRMNPAGISYMYAAFNRETAVAETISARPTVYVMSKWKTLRKLVVLDLSRLPALPSQFDETKRRQREALLFLGSFICDISKPVGAEYKDQIEYVPTQVVSEYFAHVFPLTGNSGRLDGLQYQSAKRPEGINVVLFPSPMGQIERFPNVSLVGHDLQSS